jgi:hypothetical protein
VLKLLKKRLFSSPAAFAHTLAQHRRTLAGADAARPSPQPGAGCRTWAFCASMIDRVEEEYADDDAYEEATLDAVESASRLWPNPHPRNAHCWRA